MVEGPICTIWVDYMVRLSEWWFMWLGFKSAVIVICDLCPEGGKVAGNETSCQPPWLAPGEKYMKDPQTIHET